MKKNHIRKVNTKIIPIDYEEWRIQLLCTIGLHYETIARRIYGNGDQKFEPSEHQVRRVGRIARLLDCSPLQYRRGENQFARKLLTRFGSCVPKRIPDTPKFMLDAPR